MNKCGCKIVMKTELAFADIDTDDYKIEYCPLHAAAEEMLKALKESLDELEGMGCRLEVIQRVDKTISRASGKEAK